MAVSSKTGVQRAPGRGKGSAASTMNRHSGATAAAVVAVRDGAMPATPEQVLSLQRTAGNAAVADALGLSWPLQRALDIKLKKSGFFDEKDPGLHGTKSKKSFEARLEAESVLRQGVDERASALVAAFTSGLSHKDAFKKIAFTLEGKTDGVEAGFTKATTEPPGTGEDLRDLIATHFSGQPGAKTADYLLAILDNGGHVPLTAEVWLTLGLVDSPVADDDRLVTILERAPRDEWETAWTATAPLIEEHADYKRTYTRLAALENVRRQGDAIAEEQAAGRTVPAKTKRKLSQARDEQLGAMIRQRIQKTAGVKTGVHVRDLLDDIRLWKSTASPADLAAIRRRDSAFRKALRQIPGNFITGMKPSERQFLADLATERISGTTDTEKAGELRKQTALGTLEHRKRSSAIELWLRRGKWETLESQIRLMDKEEKEEFLEHFGSSTGVALAKLDAEMRAAKLDEQDRTVILAHLNNRFGEVGTTYEKLLRFLSPVSIKEKAKASSEPGERIFKLVSGLRNEEFAQVLLDSGLITRMQEKSGSSWWEKTRLVLGISSSGTVPVKSSMTDQKILDRSDRERSSSYFSALVNGMKVPSKGKVFKILLRAQGAARRQAEKKGLTEKDEIKEHARQFLEDIFVKLQPAAQLAVNEAPKLVSAINEGKTLKVDKLVKKAGRRRWIHADRAMIVSAFTDIDDKVLLDQWSNLNEFTVLGQGLAGAKQRQTDLDDEIVNLSTRRDNHTPGGTKYAKYDAELLQKKAAAATNAELAQRIQKSMNHFVFGMSTGKRRMLRNLKNKLGSEDLFKTEKMFTERLTKAVERDQRVKDAIALASLPYDDWMKANMKAVDVLMSQRKLDTTRQWDAFSGKSAELDEGTRKVKGTVLSGNLDIEQATTDQKTPSQIADLKKHYSQKAETEIQDREVLEAQFRDIQAKFNARLMLIVQLILTAAVMAVTMGTGAPLSLGLMAAIAAGQTIIKAGFKYFVLKQPIDQVLVEGVFDVFAQVVGMLSFNIGMAAQASFLHPDMLSHGSEFLSPALGKSIGKTISQVTMFFPKTVVKYLYDQKPLESVLEKGKEATFQKALKKSAVKGLKNIPKTWGRAVFKAAQGEAQSQTESAITGTPRTPPPTTPQQDFGTAFVGGIEGDNSARVIRQQKRAIKKAIMKDLGIDPKDYVLKNRKDPERALIDSKINEYAAMKAIRTLEREEREKRKALVP